MSYLEVSILINGTRERVTCAVGRRQHEAPVDDGSPAVQGRSTCLDLHIRHPGPLSLDRGAAHDPLLHSIASIGSRGHGVPEAARAAVKVPRGHVHGQDGAGIEQQLQ